MTKVHVHGLAGCTPTPLGHYLKALGVLRLVAEQADSSARGWWRDERFWLATELDETALIEFFVSKYVPTPLLSPWNGGSGFYDQGKADDPVAAIERSKAARLKTLREAVHAARKLLVGRNSKPSPGQEKDGLVAKFVSNVRGPFERWLGSAVALVEARPGASATRYPALLGTGGNDGNLDYTDQFLRQLPLLMALDTGEPTAVSTLWLRASFWAVSVAGLTYGASGRQFDPGGAGGSNLGAGFSGRSALNPWDYILSLEGTVLFRVAVTRSSDSRSPRLAAPFATVSVAAGCASISDAEAGEEEQWFPIWHAPATLREIQAVLAEGRATLGRARASDSVDFVRAVARLGVQRGVSHFVRVGYEVRNGNMHFAVPLGRWRVASSTHRNLLDEIDGWLAGLRRAGRDEHARPELTAISRRCDEAVLNVSREGATAERWQRLLIALGEAERVVVASPRHTVTARLRPIPSLSPEWIDAADDGSCEVRLGLALASQHALAGRSPELPVRRHWSPVTANGRGFEIRNDSVVLGPDVVCLGLDLEKDCAAMVMRRVVMASHRPKDASYPEGRLPLRAFYCAGLDDLMLFLDGATRDTAILGLARAFMAIDWQKLGRQNYAAAAWAARIDADYAIIRLAHAPDGVLCGDERVPVGLDPETSRRLVAGDLPRAAAVAIRRLRASGLRPVLHILTGDAARGRRLTASLAFPITADDLARCADRVTKPFNLFESPEASDSAAYTTEAS
ncbi:MAG: type I-U CRISPR-associated protein Csx17 [Candidatus Binatia bacterium]